MIHEALPNMPINSLAWFIGALAVFTLSYRSWLAWRKRPGEFAGYYIKFSFILAISLIFFGSPIFFPNNPELIKQTYLTALAFFYVSLVYQAIILWYVGFKTFLPKWPFIVFSGVLGGVAWISSALSTNPSVEGGMMHYNVDYFAAAVQGILLITLLIPTGFFFIKEGLSQKGLARVKSIGIGVASVVIGLSQAYTDFARGGEETLENSYLNLYSFVILLLILALPSSLRDRLWFKQPVKRRAAKAAIR